MPAPPRQPAPEGEQAGDGGRQEQHVQPVEPGNDLVAGDVTPEERRGWRNAPMKNSRSRCRHTAATKISAAQWWTCRISSPPRTSKLRCRADSYALLTGTPRSGPYEP